MSRQEVIEIRFHLLLIHQKVGKIWDTEVLDTRELRMMIAQKEKKKKSPLVAQLATALRGNQAGVQEGETQAAPGGLTEEQS